MGSRGKVLIVGGGIAGLSTAWALTRRGFAVELFEQGPLPNPKASSYDEHRITRHAYGPMTGYARMMPEAFRVWDALWTDLGVRHFDPLPMLVLMREADPWYRTSLDSLAELGIAHRELSPAETARRYPMIAPEGLSAAFEAEGAGVLFPIRILTDLVVWLAAAGVTLHAQTQVSAIDAERATVTAGGRTHHGDHLVVAAGAWVTRLVPELIGTAVPSRQAVAFLAPPVELAAAWAAAPVIIDIGRDSGTYTLPPRPGTRLKLGDHQFTRQGDPDGDRLAAEAEIERLLAAARLAFSGFEHYRVLERKACFYTVTEDERFIARAIGSRGHVISACSGHGFKLGPLIGNGVAAVIAGDRPAGTLAAWAAGRTAEPAAGPALP